MGQKVNPIAFRMGIKKDWESMWCLRSNYVAVLHEDIAVRNYIMKTFKHAMIGRVVIKRQSDCLSVVVHATRVGIIIGKGGSDVEKIKKHIHNIVNNVENIEVNVVEVKRFETCAKLIALNISQQLEKRISFRKAMKRAISSALRAGSKGIKISCSGRLGGAEIARREWYKEGSIPLHTLKANIDYGASEANTTYGVIGTKVWVYNENK